MRLSRPDLPDPSAPETRGKPKPPKVAAPKSTVWIVGHWPEDESAAWEIQGIFTSYETARRVAQAVGRCFFGEVELDKEDIPRAPTPLPGGWSTT